MNRAKLVVVMTLGLLVLGLAGILYYYNLRPILAEGGNPAWRTVFLPVGAVSDEIAIDPNGKVWVSGSRIRYTNEGGYLAMWDGSTWQEFTTDQVGLDPVAKDFDFDSTGRVWIAVPTGAASFDGKTWAAYALQAGEDCLWSTLAIDRRDRVWLGGEGCGVINFDRNAWVKLQANRSFGYHVSVLAVDPLGRIWVGTDENKGLFVYDGTGWTEYPISLIPYLKNKQDSKKGMRQGVWIRDIAFDSAGRAWIATNEGLISLSTLAADEGSRPDWRLEIQTDRPNTPYVLRIETDGAGRVYATSLYRQGIIIRDAGQWKNIGKIQNTFGLAEDLPDGQSLAIHPDGSIWISAHEYAVGQQRLFILNYNQLSLYGSQAFEVGASDRLPVLAFLTLALLLLLLVAALLTRPAGSEPQSGQISSSRWKLGWVLANGLAWLTAAGVMLLPLYWLGTLSTTTFSLAKSFILWMPVVGIVLSAIWAAGQWIGLAAVLQQAGRWSAYAFFGTLGGFLGFYVCGAIILTILPAAIESIENNAIIVPSMTLLCFPPIVGVLYFATLWLAGYLTGRLQTRLLATIAPSLEKWAKRNAKIMALSGLLGPLGGIVYALLSGEILQPNLFGEEIKD